MKTKFLKIGMPIMVFMLAIVFAFATEKTNTENESVLITGYVMQGTSCVTSTKDCNNIGAIPCKDDAGRDVYLIRLSNTFCSDQLFHWAP